MTVKSWRQGDVCLIEVASIPKDAKPVKSDARGVVLMEGEATGHHHRFPDDGGTTLLERDNGERFVEKTKPSPLSHEEHDAIMFTGKKFQQVFQVEDSGEDVRPVID